MSTEELMLFFKGLWPRIKISYGKVTLLCLVLHMISLPSGCVFWAAPLVRDLEFNEFIYTLFFHPHGVHNNVPHVLQDVGPGFRAWAVATEHRKAKWPYAGSEPLCSVCKSIQLTKSLLSALCMSNILQRKVLTIYSQAAAMERILDFLHSPLLAESSQINHSLMDC